MKMKWQLRFDLKAHSYFYKLLLNTQESIQKANRTAPNRCLFQTLILRFYFLLQTYIGSFINYNCYQPSTQPQSEKSMEHFIVMLKEPMMPTLSACLVLRELQVCMMWWTQHDAELRAIVDLSVELHRINRDGEEFEKNILILISVRSYVSCLKVHTNGAPHREEMQDIWKSQGPPWGA